jgi:hypothetical protein
MTGQRRAIQTQYLCCVCCLLILCLCSAEAAAASKVLVLVDPQNNTHQLVLEPLLQLNTAGPETDAAVKITALDYRNQNQARIDAADLLITIGVHAAAHLQTERPSVAVLNVLIPQEAYDGLNVSAENRPAVIFLDQPIERQFALARALLPATSRAGMLLGHRSAEDLAGLRQAAGHFMLDLEIVTVEADTNPAAAIRQVLKDSDIVVSTFERETYTAATAKWLLYLALQKRRPIIGFSRALLQAGAVAAVFSTPRQIATHTAELIDEWLETGVAPSGAVYPRHYRIGLNPAVAARLGLDLPPEQDLRMQVRQMLGETP